jgi:hypothetical protein
MAGLNERPFLLCTAALTRQDVWVRPALITTFEAEVPDEEQLNNLTLWLDQTEFAGFEDVDYRFEYSPDGTIGCRVPEGVPADQLARLCVAVDQALARIARDLAPRTRIAH